MYTEKSIIKRQAKEHRMWLRNHYKKYPIPQKSHLDYLGNTFLKVRDTDDYIKMFL